eukprot:GHVQ01032377.1.p1 GENE.GHVQ01032377.1~~GHVQ01032377.1.p1  ORF type:complete len:313 (-),score=55.79 GHVQ01032377.1:1299-2237(-)
MATEEMKEFKRQYDNLLNQPYVFYDDERLLSNTKKVVKMLEQEQHSQQTIEIEKPVRDMVEEVSRPAIGRRRRDEIATDFSMLVRKYQQILANINTVLEDPTKISQADAEQQLVQNLTQVREKVMENLRTLEQHSQQTIEIEKPVRDMVEEVSRPAIGRRRRDEIATDFSMLVRNQHLLANINTMLEDPTKISQADAEQQLVQNLTQAREKQPTALQALDSLDQLGQDREEATNEDKYLNTSISCGSDESITRQGGGEALAELSHKDAQFLGDVFVENVSYDNVGYDDAVMMMFVTVHSRQQRHIIGYRGEI